MGEGACWLDQVCLDCGRFLDAEEVEDEGNCPHCGAELQLRA